MAAVGNRGSGRGRDRQDNWHGGCKRKADGDGRVKRQKLPYKELGICWAHYKFGRAAYDCQKPCLFAGN